MEMVLREDNGKIRSEKGFTLVELLATIVILGIIAAIAVPSIGKLMDNSKKDAHVANAEQVIEAARLYVLSESISDKDISLDLEKLSTDGYLDHIPKIPGEDDNYASTSSVSVTKNGQGKYTYRVTLTGSGGTYIKNVKEEDLTRSKVKQVN